MPDSGDPSRGMVHGYELRSAIPFATTRAGAGRPLHVEARAEQVGTGTLLGTWEQRPGVAFRAELFQVEERFWFWASDIGWFAVDPRIPSITVPVDCDPLLRELRLFGVPTSLCALADGDLSIHASAVEVYGQGIMIAGPSMYGKTTLAAAFAGAGHRLLSEDTTHCSLAGEPAVYPGPAVVRLRPDVVPHLHLADAPSRDLENGRRVVLFDARQRGTGAAVPLSAVMFLRESTGVPTMREANAAIAARDLFALSFRLPNDDSRARCFSSVVELTARVQMLDLHRPKTIASLSEVISMVERYVGGT